MTPKLAASKLADLRTQLPPERWATLLALAAALGFRLPGPNKGRTRNQLHIFWQRAVRSSVVPDVELWAREGREFWYTWPSSSLGRSPPAVRGVVTQRTTRSTLQWSRGPDRDVAHMEALVKLT